MAASNAKIYKAVKPQGDVLNDNGMNIDHLGHVVYAEALANQIERIRTPVTIGLFARWGSGKSFLLKHIQSIVSPRSKTLKKNKKKKKVLNVIGNVILFFLFAAIVAALPFVFLIVVNIPGLGVAFLLSGLALLFLFLASQNDSVDNASSSSWYRFSKVVFRAFFKKLPIKPNPASDIRSIPPTDYIIEHKDSDQDKLTRKVEMEEIKKQSRFIFVNYNAWQYAGCEVLWAGIVKALAEKVEAEFGIFTTRMFRSINLETVVMSEKDDSFNHRQLFLKFLSEAQDCDKIRNILKEYQFRSVQTLEDWKKNKAITLEVEDEEKYRVVEFAEVDHAKKVFDFMQRVKDVKASFAHPTYEKCHSPSDFNNSSATPSSMPTDSDSESGWWEEWRWNNVAILVGFIIAIASSIVFSVLSFLPNVFSSAESDEEPVEIKVLGILPGGFALLFVVGRMGFAFIYSQENRIVSVLQGAKKNLANELGFMSKIKEEIETITNLVHTVKLVHNITYKIVVTIDDLDRVPLKKVKSVLEAVNILLSDRLSPFICIIAIDSRVAIDCFAIPDENEDRPTVNGHEYLKKIINLPFCLPEIDDETKPMYIMGLIDEADDTAESHREMINFCDLPEGNSDTEKHSKSCWKKLKPSSDAAGYRLFEDEEGNSDTEKHSKACWRKLKPSSDAAGYRLFEDEEGNSDTEKHSKACWRKPKPTADAAGYQPNEEEEAHPHVVIRQPGTENTPFPCASTSPSRHLLPVEYSELSCTPRVPINFEKFLYTCRHLMYKDKILLRHMHGNPRNIKRIFNVVSITASVIKSLQTRDCKNFEKRPFTELSNASGSSDASQVQEKNNEEFAKEVLYWIMLTDQWPFRMSYLLVIIEDADQRQNAGRDDQKIEDFEPLFDIYKKYLKGTEKNEVEKNHERFLCLDGDPDVMYSLLEISQKFMTKSKAKEMLKYTTNLDSNLKESIAAKRANIDSIDNMSKNKQAQDTVDAGPPSESNVKPATSNRKQQNVALRDYSRSQPVQQNQEPAGRILMKNSQKAHDTVDAGPLPESNFNVETLYRERDAASRVSVRNLSAQLDGKSQNQEPAGDLLKQKRSEQHP